MLLKADRVGSLYPYTSHLFKFLTAIPQIIFHCHHSGANRKKEFSVKSCLSPILPIISISLYPISEHQPTESVQR